VKRLHDRDRTGWWLLWQLLIIAVAVILVIVAIAVPKDENTVWYVLAGAAGLTAFLISLWLRADRLSQGNARAEPLRARPARRLERRCQALIEPSIPNRQADIQFGKCRVAEDDRAKRKSG
jgi:hypothetical protein